MAAVAEEERLAEMGKEEKGEEASPDGSVEDVSEEQGEEKQQPPGQAETTSPRAESQKVRSWSLGRLPAHQSRNKPSPSSSWTFLRRAEPREAS
ncbi:hypoxia up-regulated protein 1-like isoform X1 [Lathamus discolor]|uniref:hypoxia up-regulated protein 1-like isoform X1 n=1 Tax=Lathamus discolor TaxID=678569 RepID=UPI0032B7B7CD